MLRLNDCQETIDRHWEIASLNASLFGCICAPCELRLRYWHNSLKFCMTKFLVLLPILLTNCADILQKRNVSSSCVTISSTTFWEADAIFVVKYYISCKNVLVSEIQTQGQRMRYILRATDTKNTNCCHLCAKTSSCTYAHISQSGTRACKVRQYINWIPSKSHKLDETRDHTHAQTASRARELHNNGSVVHSKSASLRPNMESMMLWQECSLRIRQGREDRQIIDCEPSLYARKG